MATRQHDFTQQQAMPDQAFITLCRHLVHRPVHDLHCNSSLWVQVHFQKLGLDDYAAFISVVSGSKHPLCFFRAVADRFDQGFLVVATSLDISGKKLPKFPCHGVASLTIE